MNCIATRKHAKRCNIPDARHYYLMIFVIPLFKLDLANDNRLKLYVKTGYCLQCGRTYHGVMK